MDEITDEKKENLMPTIYIAFVNDNSLFKLYGVSCEQNIKKQVYEKNITKIYS